MDDDANFRDDEKEQTDFNPPTDPEDEGDLGASPPPEEETAFIASPPPDLRGDLDPIPMDSRPPDDDKPPAPAAKKPGESVPFWSPDSLRRRIFHAAVMGVMFLGVIITWAVVAKPGEWPLAKTIIFTIPFVLALGFAVLFHTVVRAKTRIYRNWTAENPDDPHGQRLLVVFDLSNKALYVPTIVLSFANAFLMYLKEAHGWLEGLNPALLGGIWLGQFFVNFLVEEFDVDLKVILTGTFAVVAVFLWVSYMEWLAQFLDMFKTFGIRIDAAGFFLIGLIFVVVILYSYIKGAFYYMVITPNYINIQTGITKTGEQIGHEGYSTNVEANDLLERLFGFGRIVITFRDTRRMPLKFLVFGIGKAARKLERIRSILMVDGER